MKKLIIIPAYNEEESLGSVISEVKKHGDYDILVVNDGSTDHTLDVILEHKVDFIHFEQNQGIGSAMQAGYRYAYKNDYDIAVQIDGDGQHDVERLEALSGRVSSGEYDLVIGSRYIVNTDYPATFFRRNGSRYLSFLIYLMYGVRIHDPTSGFRVAGRRVIQLFTCYYPKDYPEVPTLAYLLKHNYRVCEMPVHMKQRQGGRSSISATDSLIYILKVSLACILCKAGR